MNSVDYLPPTISMITGKSSCNKKDLSLRKNDCVLDEKMDYLLDFGLNSVFSLTIKIFSFLPLL